MKGAAFERTMRGLAAESGWRRDVVPRPADAEERPAQVLRLAPTPRSLLR